MKIIYDPNDPDNIYNKEPVYYCTHCMSLNIRTLNSYCDYCDNCGGTDIETTDIFTWKKLYEDRFGEEN